jgi:hypothetical protein
MFGEYIRESRALVIEKIGNRASRRTLDHENGAGVSNRNFRFKVMELATALKKCTRHCCCS